MKKWFKEYGSLFGTGVVQVCLVAINTWQISQSKWIGAFIVGFLISFVWTFNVKKVAFGNMWHRIAYAGGAAIGTILGLFIAKQCYE